MAIFLEVYHIYRLPHGPPTQGGDRLPGMLRPPGHEADTSDTSDTCHETRLRQHDIPILGPQRCTEYVVVVCYYMLLYVFICDYMLFMNIIRVILIHEV